MEKTNKVKEVLKYLRTHENGITSMIAFEEFGATRLASIINRLRNRGYDIETMTEVCKDRYGSTSQYARYILHEE